MYIIILDVYLLKWRKDPLLQADTWYLHGSSTYKVFSHPFFYFVLHADLMREVILIAPFFWWGNRSTERLSKLLLWVRQLTGRAGAQAQNFKLWILWFLPLWSPLPNPRFLGFGRLGTAHKRPNCLGWHYPLQGEKWEASESWVTQSG